MAQLNLDYKKCNNCLSYVYTRYYDGLYLLVAYE